MPDGAAAGPAVLLLHGFSSRKEEMAESFGGALLRYGIASIATDLPFHGARASGLTRLSLQNPVALVTAWKLALRESALAVDHIVNLPGVDPQRIGILGFSLGSYLSIFVAGKDPRIKSIALVAGGDLPARTPFASLVRTVADPLRAVKALAGRPLLMMDGTRDRMILPDQARALFAAAAEPKELCWYEGGHHPPRSAVNDAAQWMASRLEARPSAPSAPPDAPEGSSQSPRLRKAS